MLIMCRHHLSEPTSIRQFSLLIVVKLLTPLGSIEVKPHCFAVAWHFLWSVLVTRYLHGGRCSSLLDLLLFQHCLLLIARLNSINNDFILPYLRWIIILANLVVSVTRYQYSGRCQTNLRSLLLHPLLSSVAVASSIRNLRIVEQAECLLSSTTRRRLGRQ